MTCFPLFFIKKRASPPKKAFEANEDVSGIYSTTLYSYGELRRVTENFSPANKIGQGGFGSVYKGRLRDGSLAAIKVLSADSRQGWQEFFAKIYVIKDIKHDNLVKLYGCYVEGNHRILVYGYLENNNLAQTFLGRGRNSIQFSWHMRRSICMGVAQGLAFLHEEVQPHNVHRDIKASNILLDKDLTPKILDFGLAKLFPNNMTHIGDGFHLSQTGNTVVFEEVVVKLKMEGLSLEKLLIDLALISEINPNHPLKAFEK